MKMEIPESVKAVLRCGDCDELLSCGPVYLEHDTNQAICGRCSREPTEEEEKEKPALKSEKRSRSRNVHYEAAATLLWFPCRYAAHGCRVKMDFSEDSPDFHERDCEFRTFICPVVARGSCSWVGSHPELGEHCRDAHPTHFFENPFILPRPDFTKSSLSNFLVSAFNFLFLVHVKVCVTTGKLFHSVRFFGDSKLLEKFSYLFEMKGNGSKFIKKGSVLRPGIMMLQQPTANFSLINNLLGILDGKFDESIFTITIHSSIRNCINCLKNFGDVCDSEFCGECRGKLVKCKFNKNGCLFVDFNSYKCEKHERNFCHYQMECCLCKVNFVGGSLIEHLSSSTSCRKTTKANIDSVVRVTRNVSIKWEYILFSCKSIGTILCQHIFYHSKFQLNLRSSLPSRELKNFKCSIKLTDPRTKHTQILTPQIDYNNWNDWYINEKMDDFPSWENIGIDIKINVHKN